MFSRRRIHTLISFSTFSKQSLPLYMQLFCCVPPMCQASCITHLLNKTANHRTVSDSSKITVNLLQLDPSFTHHVMYSTYYIKLSWLKREWFGGSTSNYYAENCVLYATAVFICRKAWHAKVGRCAYSVSRSFNLASRIQCNSLAYECCCLGVMQEVNSGRTSL
jgi:hypothetical protein